MAIDAIDDNIVALLRDRMRLVEQVGEIKRASGQQGSFIRSGREASMLRQLAAKLSGTMSPRAAAGIWRVIIASSLSAEKAFNIYAGPAKSDAAYWLAREYFGGVIPVSPLASDEDVVRRILEDPIAVGVLSVQDGEPMPWWLRPAEEKNDLYIFASLPFAGGGEYAMPETFAFANVVPEKTDADATLLAIACLRDEAAAALLAIEGEGGRIHARSPGGLLASLPEYAPAGTGALSRLACLLPPGASVRVLGHYAVPLV